MVSLHMFSATRAIEAAHKLKAGQVFVNSASPNVPFGGYKQSGLGGEMGQYALDEYVMNRCFERRNTNGKYSYTVVKAVHINLGYRL